MPTPSEASSMLDARVVQALGHYQALIEAGKHVPSPRAAAALLALSRCVAERLEAARTAPALRVLPGGGNGPQG